MADTEEMRRLILHASTRLSEELSSMGEHGHPARSTIAAMACAVGVMHMVAACMGVEEQPPTGAGADPIPSPEPPAGGPRRTRRMGGNS